MSAARKLEMEPMGLLTYPSPGYVAVETWVWS